MRISLLLTLAAALLGSLTLPSSVSAAGTTRYDHHHLIRMDLDISTPEKTNHIKQTLNTIKSMKRWTIDFWTGNDLAVHPQNVQEVITFLKQSGISTTIVNTNIQNQVDAESTRTEFIRLSERSLEGKLSPSDFFTDYRSNDEIVTYFQQLQKQYPDLITTELIGESFGGLPIYAYTVTSKKSLNAPVKPALYFEGGIHAREWIAHATVAYMATQFITLYGHDAHITSLVDQFEWKFVPVVNVDGYVYTTTTDRMWRKTRTPNSGSTCVGVDPNRNWDSHFGQEGSSSDPCDDSYSGPSPFSEKCVAAVSSYIKTHTNIQAVIDFHSYSQLWMEPYGYTASLPKDSQTQAAMSNAAVAALTAVNGTQYGVGPIYTTIYPASGSSADWAYDAAGVIYSFGVELRDTGSYGFTLPADQIVPSGEETLEAIKSMGDYLAQHPYTRPDALNVAEKETDTVKEIAPVKAPILIVSNFGF